MAGNEEKNSVEETPAGDLNDLVELEIVREVDADGNPVTETEAEEDAAAAGTEAEAPPPDPLAALEEERDRLREDLLRAQADFINFRKRMEREKSEVVRRASQSLIEEMLPVIDNFELALANDPEQADPETYREGVRLIHKQLLDLLSRQGLEEIECVGESFDPNVHEAVAVINDPDRENNTVVAQLKKGYTLRGQLIRPPLVQVVVHDQGGENEAEPEAAND